MRDIHTHIRTGYLNEVYTLTNLTCLNRHPCRRMHAHIHTHSTHACVPTPSITTHILSLHVYPLIGVFCAPMVPFGINPTYLPRNIVFEPVKIGGRYIYVDVVSQ